MNSILRFQTLVLRRLPNTTVAARRWLPSWGPPTPPVDRKEVEFRVMRALSKHDKIEAKALTLETHFETDLGLDSLDLVECVVELEDEFKVDINDVSAEQLLTVGQVVALLVQQLESRVDQNRRPDIEFKEGMSESRPIN